MAIAIGASAAALASPTFVGPCRSAVLVAACAFGASGFVEDMVGVPALRRLGLQVVAAFLALPWLLASFEGGGLVTGLFAVGTALWLVSFVNAFNFMDGIDGISVVQTIVAGGAWWIIGRVEDLPILGAGSLILAAAAAGFAPFNFPRARMFLGDVGSYFLGAWLAVLAVIGMRAGLPPEAVIAPISLYLTDTAITLLGRVRRGASLIDPHRDHTYQRLVRLGWSHVQTTLFVGALMVVISALGALSLLGHVVIRVVGDVLMICLLLAYIVLPRWIRGQQTGDPSLYNSDG